MEFVVSDSPIGTLSKPDLALAGFLLPVKLRVMSEYAHGVGLPPIA